jgi:hypothetical protein
MSRRDRNYLFIANAVSIHELLHPRTFEVYPKAGLVHNPDWSLTGNSDDCVQEHGLRNLQHTCPGHCK